MTTLRSSDYEAGWRLRCEGVCDGRPWAFEGVLTENGHVAVAGLFADLAWRLGEKDDIPYNDVVTDITVLDRPSPFEMGARVVLNRTGRSGVVRRFELQRSGFPLGAVVVDCGDATHTVQPDGLTLAPEPPQVEVGSWWMPGSGTPRVCTDVRPESGTVRMRQWKALDSVAYYAADVLADWTRLDGPPEPAIGDVYEIAGTVWQRGADGFHRRVGIGAAFTWDQHGKGRHRVVEFHTPADLATLRIIGNVGGEG